MTRSSFGYSRATLQESTTIFLRFFGFGLTTWTRQSFFGPYLFPHASSPGLSSFLLQYIHTTYLLHHLEYLRAKSLSILCSLRTFVRPDVQFWCGQLAIYFLIFGYFINATNNFQFWIFLLDFFFAVCISQGNTDDTAKRGEEVRYGYGFPYRFPQFSVQFVRALQTLQTSTKSRRIMRFYHNFLGCFLLQLIVQLMRCLASSRGSDLRVWPHLVMSIPMRSRAPL